uniref:Uncharacterized protein n=1 Tax=viral metagenome TaxID=1070528 RepID=A0A6C0D1I5_9ZZZZ
MNTNICLSISASQILLQYMFYNGWPSIQSFNEYPPIDNFFKFVELHYGYSCIINSTDNLEDIVIEILNWLIINGYSKIIDKKYLYTYAYKCGNKSNIPVLNFLLKNNILTIS